MLKDEQQMITAYFASRGILVGTRWIRGGLSIYTKARNTPIVRLVPTGKGNGVEVMWYSHCDRWDHIGDLGGMTMPLDKALEYVVNDVPGCFFIDFLRFERSRK